MFSSEQFLAFAEHHGVLSLDELHGIGLSDAQVKRRYAAGLLARPYPRVYRLTAGPPLWIGDARALALSVSGVISHRSAAYLWGFDERQPSPIEATIAYRRRTRVSSAVVHRSKQFDLIDDVEIEGVPVTGPARTVLDCAAVYSPKELGFLVDTVIRSKLLDWPDLYDVYIRHAAKGRNGTGKLRQFLDDRYGDRRVPDSRWNRMVGTLLEDSDVNQPVYEHEIYRSDGRFIGRVDLAFPDARLAIELDSVKHHLNHESFVADARRKNALQLAGWTVLTFTWSDYVDQPHQLVSSVRTMLTNLNR